MAKWFWCEKHKKAEQAGEDAPDCLLVGPFSSMGTANAWNGAVRDADREMLGADADHFDGEIGNK